MDTIFYSAINEFPIMALIAIGFYISFRFLKFPDLTVDAAYMFGMTAVGIVVLSDSTNNCYSFIISLLLGASIGATTGFLYSMKAGKILAGMLVAFASYSISYRMLGNTASLSLFAQRDNLSLFDLNEYTLFINIIIVAMIYFFVVTIMRTPFGYGMKASGSNSEVIEILGISSNLIIIFGLAFSNTIVAIAGWLNAITNTNVQLSNFSMIINALATVLIGEFILIVIYYFVPKLESKINSLYLVLLIPIIGAFFYTLIKSFVLHFLSGELKVFTTTDFQIVLSMIILILIILTSKIKKHRGQETDDVF